MLTRNDFHPYQDLMFNHVITHSGSGLFVEMGLGKTTVALTVADHVLNETMEVTRILVIAPKKVAQSVWKQEAQKWNHLKHLRFSLILGSEKQRKQALQTKADIYVINRENVPWLVALSAGRFRFDMVIIDESSSFKNQESKRFRAMKAVLPALKRLILLTGTPMPNTLLDLWAQLFLIDKGKRLGENFTDFRDTYFEKDPYRPFVYNLKGVNSKSTKAEKEKIQAQVQKIITDKISDVCISLQEKDYLKLPPRIDRIVEINFSPDQWDEYQQFEEDEILNLPDDKEITAVNAAGLTNKLLQFANGAVYDEFKDYHVVHDEKLDRLGEIIEDAAGHPVLVAYTYQSDFDRIKKRFPQVRQLKTDADIVAWNNGEIPLAAAHPASASYGLNLQGGGNILVWFGLPWNLEWYQQFNKRLHRQGQLKPVIIHHLLIVGTMDFDVLAALQSKGDKQENFMQAVKARIGRYKKAA